ncbi:hypothetical protein [Roseomonas haemaphysalidis]|uniref:DUF47 family protein n=1 Tax=Roseomonas haemaphysalidis TaxID=2768162 RepID=A0ABS3KKX1_9PROT|nr:hypothetical protein [Roseomonas haemaphysalidis]MBO1078115.1 hypothetical protein [Roseomonas haemaphysalidis]
MRYGDDRQFDTIVRHLSRIATGQARVPGEMRELLDMTQRGIDQKEQRMESEIKHSLRRVGEVLDQSARDMSLTEEEHARLNTTLCDAAGRGSRIAYAGASHAAHFCLTSRSFF